MAEQSFIKQNNLLPILVAIIGAITSIVVANIQFGGQTSGKMDFEKTQKIVNEQIDLKMAPLTTKITEMNQDIRDLTVQQQQMNQNLIDSMKTLNRKVALNQNPVGMVAVEDHIKKAETLQTIMKQEKAKKPL